MIEQQAALIRKACGYSLRVTPNDIADGLEDGRFHVFATEKAILIAEIEDYPAKGNRICDVVIAGGELSELCDVLRPQVEAWARENNCSHCEVTGRVGWRRAVQPFGYREIATSVVKEL